MRAQSGEMLIWIPRVIGVIIIIGILVFLVNSRLDENLNIDDLRFYPVAERVLYSDTCFVYEDQRPYPGIIDASKFTQEQLDRCMKPMDQSIAARIQLQYADTNETLYYNQETYEDIIPLTFSRQYRSQSKRYYVLVEDGERHPANMFIEVVWRE